MIDFLAALSFVAVLYCLLPYKELGPPGRKILRVFMYIFGFAGIALSAVMATELYNDAGKRNVITTTNTWLVDKVIAESKTRKLVKYKMGCIIHHSEGPIALIMISTRKTETYNVPCDEALKYYE